jgi:hypothetical protein
VASAVTRLPGDSPQGLLERLRAAGVERDAFLLGGRSTLHAFLALGAIDRLELLEFPVLLGEGVPFSLPGTPQLRGRVRSNLRRRRTLRRRLSLSHNAVRRAPPETPAMRGIERRSAAAPGTTTGGPGLPRRSKEDVGVATGRSHEVGASCAAADKCDVHV